MNTEELKTFIYLSKVKNFTLAAHGLFVAQSTVTNRIGELEKEVGKKLVNRGTKTATLTEEGKIFLRYAERMLELQATSISEMNALSTFEHIFAVGAINATYEMDVKPILERCMQESKDTSVKVVLDHSIDLIQLLQDNLLDIVFSGIPLKKAGYECKPYATDRLALVAGKTFKGYENGITREEFAKAPYMMCDFTFEDVTHFIRSLFPENHTFKVEVDYSSKLLPYIKDGNGITFYPYKMVADEIQNGTLREIPLLGIEPPVATTYIIYHQGYNPNGFLKYAKK